MLKRSFTVSAILLALAACSPDGAKEQAQQAPAVEMTQAVPDTPADWVASEASVGFLSSKVNKQLASITEQSRFTSSKASLDKQGAFKMEVDLSSVNTGIEIRDQRLKDWVFEVAQFAKADISGQVDAAAVNKLGIGEVLRLKQPLKLNIHGQTLDLEADLSVQRVSADKIEVATLNPVLLDIQQMKMEKGVAQLVEVMGLTTIVGQIPVSFNAEFTRQP